MIRYFLIQNRQGKTRLAKWYIPLEDHEKRTTQIENWKTIVNRDRSLASVVEGQNSKIVYRKYAALYFTISCDLEDNDLLMLETIHLFVEILDSYFGNVCELDLVFQFFKVFAALDEVIVGGEVMETNINTILKRLRLLEKMD
eukprot:TRINITY_DN2257_c0_g1_i1.p1 TRINITY_DN2257_c0_g1~~TRINITY_DN2257_c0_g1_i1.p1  ORF type:complete len:143 (+),score=29.85 TRINITY_DN2257_c0_g1_i1:56-484(+)